MSDLSFENVTLMVLAIVILINGHDTEQFRRFFNMWSVDVLQLDQYDFKSTNSCVKCPRIYLPVCGSDDKTYTNECKMACMNVVKNKNPEVNMSRTGPCNMFS